MENCENKLKMLQCLKVMEFEVLSDLTFRMRLGFAIFYVNNDELDIFFQPQPQSIAVLYL